MNQKLTIPFHVQLQSLCDDLQLIRRFFEKPSGPMTGEMLDIVRMAIQYTHGRLSGLAYMMRHRGDEGELLEFLRERAPDFAADLEAGLPIVLAFTDHFCPWMDAINACSKVVKGADIDRVCEESLSRLITNHLIDARDDYRKELDQRRVFAAIRGVDKEEKASS